MNNPTLQSPDTINNMANEIENLLDCAFTEMTHSTPEDEGDLRNIRQTIIELAQSEGAVFPEDVLPLIDCGRYKAVFDLTPHWVVKFTSNNPTFRVEYTSLMAAHQRGVGVIFPTMHCITCPGIRINSTIMYKKIIDKTQGSSSYSSTSIHTTEEENDYRYKYRRPFDTIIFQRKGAYLLSNMRNKLTLITSTVKEKQAAEESHEILYDYNDKLIRKGGITSPGYLWTADLKRIYGEEFISNWRNFESDWGITDLHSNNLGYIIPTKRELGREPSPYDHLPVIFDWMSDSAPLSEKRRSVSEEYTPSSQEWCINDNDMSSSDMPTSSFQSGWR